MTRQVASENIPADLSALHQWVCWKYEERNDKRTKAPIDAKSNGRLLHAKSNDRATWSDFDTALAACGRHPELAGVGFCFAPEDGLTGLDLDHVIDPDTGELKPEAAEVLQRFAGTYAEISPSGDGLRLFCRGKPQRSGKNAGKVKWLEVYSYPSHRYLTVTGNRWGGNATAITDQKAALDWLHERFMVSTGGGAVDTKPAAVPPALDDAALLAKARVAKNGADFDRLWSGATSGHGGDHSSADLALCNMLAFWTGNDADRMDRLFRQSGLMREKWDDVHYSDGRTYGRGTIDKAIEGRDKPVQEKSKKRGAKAQAIITTKVILETSQDWRGVLAYDEFSGRIVKRRAPPFLQSENGQWDEIDAAELTLWLADKDLCIAKDTLDKIITAIAHRNSFNPAQDRLNGLAAGWDGERRLDNWLTDYLKAKSDNTNDIYLRELGKCWMIGVVARIMKPGCKRDDVLTLVGPQDVGKSKVAKMIAETILPGTFIDSLGDLSNDDARNSLRGKIIVEFAELASVRRSQIEAVKSFITTESDCFRMKYDRDTREHPRTVSFIATTNEMEGFLTDTTGNRRWFPIIIDSAIAFDNLETVLPQLLGEATERFKKGEPWYLTDPVAIAQARGVREDHREDDPLKGAVIVAINTTEEKTVFTIDYIMNILGLDNTKRTTMLSKRIAAILKELGYSRKKFRDREHLVWGWFKS